MSQFQEATSTTPAPFQLCLKAHRPIDNSDNVGIRWIRWLRPKQCPAATEHGLRWLWPIYKYKYRYATLIFFTSWTRRNSTACHGAHWRSWGSLEPSRTYRIRCFLDRNWLWKRAEQYWHERLWWQHWWIWRFWRYVENAPFVLAVEGAACSVAMESRLHCDQYWPLYNYRPTSAIWQMRRT